MLRVGLYAIPGTWLYVCNVEPQQVRSHPVGRLCEPCIHCCTYQKLRMSLGLPTTVPLAGLHGMYLRAPARTAQAAAAALALGAAARGLRGLGVQLVRKCMNSCGCMGSL